VWCERGWGRIDTQPRLWSGNLKERGDLSNLLKDEKICNNLTVLLFSGMCHCIVW
jgi:hypothetical protein